MAHGWIRQVIPGLYTLDKAPFSDSRGSFHKIMCQRPDDVKQLDFDEIYWSSSEQGVVRGMHLQIPPFHGRKLVFATLGKVRDFVIDLRAGSPTYRNIWETHLSPESPGVLIPAGCAHGFAVTAGPATLVYAQEGDYSQECDTGVNLRSIGLANLTSDSVISERDQQLPTLAEFNSPFVYDESEYSHWNSN
jgi:dTDP-4-dehydrorhamnose 3,5-epimerase